MSWQALNLTKPAGITGSATLAELQALATEVSAVMVHPFQYGVGEGQTRALHLSFPNAVEAMATKLQELQPQAATCLALASNKHDQFALQLQSVIDETQILWLLTPQQRAGLLAELEQQKWLVKDASTVPVPVRHTHTLLHIGKIAECYQAKGRELAKTEGTSAIGDISAEISEFESRKTQHDTDADNAMNNVQLATAPGLAVSLTGGDIANQLRNAGGPGPEQSLAMILCFYGSTDELLLINQLLGLA